MPVISESVHPQSLDFVNQRRVVVLRDVKGLAWSAIRKEVRNLKGKAPSVWLVRETYGRLSRKVGHRKYNYGKCGRQAWKVTKAVERFLLGRLRCLRKTGVCTSTTLRQELAASGMEDLEESTIRRVLTKNGYHWLPRSQKRAYTAELRKKRLAFARSVVRLSETQLREKLAISMDGTVLSMAPSDPAERLNFCSSANSHMWRKKTEAASPDLAGDDPYNEQVPLSRALPLWGGISVGGYATILMHETKKLNASEWSSAVASGKLSAAIKSISPKQAKPPYHVLCDNESFMRAPQSRAAYKLHGIKLWDTPAKSPDLNPVEKFWAWLQRALRQRDLRDLRAKRPPLNKFAFKARVRNLLKTKKAQGVAKACASGFRKVRLEAIRKKGAMARC